MKTLTDKDGAVTLDADVSRAVEQKQINDSTAVFLQRELEHVKARTYDVRYTDLKARMLFPVSNEAGKGVTHITYRTYDQVGAAKIINAYANDLPRADVSARETSVPVRSLGASFGYNLDEIQSSALVGTGLDQRRATAMRRAVEKTINDVAFFGDVEHGLTGLFNHPNVPTTAAAAAWTTLTPEQILADINAALSDVYTNTNMLETATRILLPPQRWSYIMTTPRTQDSDMTIAQYVVNNSPFLNSLDDIVAVNECAAAYNTVTNAETMVVYNPSPDKMQLEIPVELELMPVEMRGLEFLVSGRARIAGLNIYYPLSVNIVTGI